MLQPFLDRLTSPLLRQLAETWFARRGSTRVTRRREIGPADFPALLPYVFLYDFSPAERRLTLRLAGEEIRRLLPQAQPGMTLEQIIPPLSLDVVRSRYLRVCEEPALMHATGRIFIDPLATGSGERLLLPLGNAAGEVHQMLGATIYQFGHHLDPHRTFAREEVETTFLPL